jgi:Protoheme ferro-lyase (ferrochelatase)
LAYQSEFGKQKWITPSTAKVCKMIKLYKRPKVIFIPLSFTSDHIETLVEIEEEYLPIVRAEGVEAFRLPALNQRSDWIEAIALMLQEKESKSPSREIAERQNLKRLLWISNAMTQLTL